MEGQQTQAKQEPISNLRVIRQASTYLPSMWEYMASIPAARPLLTASLDILHAYSLMESDSIAESSEILSRKLLAVTPAEDMPVDVFRTWLTLGPVIDNALGSNPPAQTESRSALTLEELRRRCNSIMIGFRVVTWTLEHCRVTDAFAKAMVEIMKESVDEIRKANDDPAVKDYLNALIFGGAARGADSLMSEHADGKLPFAEAVIEMVQCTDDGQRPAFGRLEIAGETAFLDALVSGAANPNVSDSLRDRLYSAATDAIISMVRDAASSLKDIKSSKSTDALWLEKSRVSMSAESLVILNRVPATYWSRQRSDVLSYASALVKSPDASVRKSVSLFFQGSMQHSYHM